MYNLVVGGNEKETRQTVYQRRLHYFGSELGTLEEGGLRVNGQRKKGATKEDNK